MGLQLTIWTVVYGTAYYQLLILVATESLTLSQCLPKRCQRLPAQSAHCRLLDGYLNLLNVMTATRGLNGPLFAFVWVATATEKEYAILRIKDARIR